MISPGAKPDGATKVKIGLIFVVVIFLGVVVFDYIERSSPSPRISTTPVATSAPVATDDRQAKVMQVHELSGVLK